MAVIRIPRAKITLTFGDAKDKPIVITSGVELISCQFQNGEGDRTNNTQITFADDGLAIATILRAKALKLGGVAVPKTLLEKDETIAGAASPVPASNKDLPKDGKPGSDLSAYIGGTAEVSLPAEYRAYLDVIAWCEGSSHNTIVGYVDTIKDFSQHPRRLVPGLSDAAGRYQFLSTTWDSLNLPNFGPQNQDLAAAALIKRRGADAAVMAGVGGADRFMDECSWEWASIPNSSGGFRYPGQGSKTPQMIRDAIAVALNYYKVGGLTKSPTSQTAGQIAPGTALSSPALLASQLAAAATPIEEPTPKDALEITVEVGWSDESEVITASFWYTRHNVSTALPPRTTIGGQGVRYLLAVGDRRRKTWQNISLRQVADRIGASYGAKVTIPSTPASEKIVQFLAQKGQTDLQFLNEVAAASGFILKESGDGAAKTLEFVSASEKGGEVVTVDRAWGCTFSSSESADDERILKELPSINSLEDGKAIGAGFVTTITIATPTIKTMRLQPGTIIKIPPGAIALLPSASAFCREYRLRASRVSLEGGKLTQVLEIYVPVNVAPKAKNAGAGSAATPIGGTSPGASMSINPPDGSGIAIAGIGLMKLSTPVLQNGQLTWGDVTHGGTRHDKMTAAMVQGAIELCKAVESIAKTALGGRPIIVTSWFRDPASNAAAGGVPDSFHLTGKAVDAYVLGLSGDEMYAKLDPVWPGGLGKYSNRFHIDVGPRARFTGG